MAYDLKRLYDYCYSRIGGDQNPDVQHILDRRRRGVTRKNFFEQAAWAIMVSGISRKAADTVSRQAVKCGFVWDYRVIAEWPGQGWEDFFQRLYPRGVQPMSRNKWMAIRGIAQQLTACNDEEHFQRDWFVGKSDSADLNEDDVARILRRGLSYVGPANAQYIVRNMGGEAIKRDRWLIAAEDYLGMTYEQLRQRLRELGISLSLFDQAVWGYCERFVGQVARFREHFDQLAGELEACPSDPGV